MTYTVHTNTFWACAVQYKVLGDDVMTMNIIKNENFRGAHSLLPVKSQNASAGPKKC